MLSRPQSLAQIKAEGLYIDEKLGNPFFQAFFNGSKKLVPRIYINQLPPKILSDPLLNSALIYSKLYPLSTWNPFLPDVFEDSRMLVLHLLSSASMMGLENMIEDVNNIRKQLHQDLKAICEAS
jgi:hypothetical protein